MLSLSYLKPEHAKLLEDWNRGEDRDFLVQWAGPGYYTYPLTASQVLEKLDIANKPNGDFYLFEITNGKTVVGSVELNHIDYQSKTATVGRFLLDPGLRGRGYGTEALKLICALAKDRFGLKTLNLRVMQYNLPALSCYKKCGFEIKEAVDYPGNAKYNCFVMEKQLDTQSKKILIYCIWQW